jgi:hypothetical protein
MSSWRYFEGHKYSLALVYLPTASSLYLNLDITKVKELVLLGYKSFIDLNKARRVLHTINIRVRIRRIILLEMFHGANLKAVQNLKRAAKCETACLED